jgi:predicted DNA-binding protein (UPF0251 family)
MQESTLKDYAEKVGTNLEAARRLGVSRQQLENAVKTNINVIVLHDEQLKPIQAKLVRNWGKL